MRTALVDTAEEVLGKVKKRQPDYFQDSKDRLTGSDKFEGGQRQGKERSEKSKGGMVQEESRGGREGEVWWKESLAEHEGVCSVLGEEGYRLG